MRILVAEKLSPHKYKTPEGYLICQDAILARTGKQTYLNREVYGDSIDNPDKEIEIDRPEAEVFSDKTLASFENKPVTIEHPDEDVNIDNHNFYSVGFVRDIKRGIDNGKPVMLGTLVVTNPDAVADIENGKLLELSCGYDCDIVDNAQTNIRGNHVALCEHGRAGNARIIDSTTSFRKDMIKGEKSMNLHDDDLSCYRAGIIDSKFKDFDDTTKNIRVVKEFIEQNGNKFNKRKDAEAILEYIKKRTGIANADYGDVLYIIKKYTRAEIADSVKDVKYVIMHPRKNLYLTVGAKAWSDESSPMIKKFDSEKEAEEYAKKNTSDFRIAVFDSVKDRQSFRLDDDIHTHFRKIEEDAKFLYREYQKGNKSPNEILSSRGYKDIQGDRLAKYDGEYTYIFNFDDDVYVKYYVLKNGKIPAGYTLTKMRFWDEQTHNNVEDFAKMKFTFSTNLAAFERAIINNDKREFDAMSNIFEKDLDDYRNWKDRLDASDKANVKHVVEKINARLKASQFSKQFKLDDSTYSEVTNELKSELKDTKLFVQKALKAIKTLKAIK